jgi:hypothetical protein
MRRIGDARRALRVRRYGHAKPHYHSQNQASGPIHRSLVLKN